MITITWNNADFGTGYSDDIRSIDFDVEQLYKVNKNNDVPQFRTESTFTVQDTVVHKPDEIECALILTEDARIPVPNGDTSYGVLSRLSDSGVPFSIDASEQGTFMSYDNVVIKSMSNMVQIGVKYICRLIFSEIRTATAEIAEETVIEGETITVSTCEELFDNCEVDYVQTHFMLQNYNTVKTPEVVIAVKNAEKKTAEFAQFENGTTKFDGTDFDMADLLLDINTHIEVVAVGEATVRDVWT